MTMIPGVPGLILAIGALCALLAAWRRRRRDPSRLPREITDCLRARRAERSGRQRRHGDAFVFRHDGDIAFILFMAAILIGLLAGDRIL